jgi:hypothetical protein
MLGLWFVRKAGEENAGGHEPSFFGKSYLSNKRYIAMVNEMYYFIAGALLIIAGLLVNRQHPRKWRTQSNLLYVGGMALLFFALFVLHDPIEGIPTELWTIIEFFSIAVTFYGFMYKIERDMRTDLNDKAAELKTDLTSKIDGLKQDFHREMDKLDNKLQSIETRVQKLEKKRGK